MFDRDSKGFLDDLNFEPDLHRFENDYYLTKYLSQCYNPEFKIRVTFPKDKPSFSERGAGIGVRQRSFTGKDEVL